MAMVTKLKALDDIMDLMHLKESDRELVEYYYDRNSQSENKTIVDIFQNFDPSLPADSQPKINYAYLTLSLDDPGAGAANGKVSNDSIKTVGGGKVQGSYAPAAATAKKSVNGANIPPVAALSKTWVLRQYGDQVEELKVYLNSNEQLRRLKDGLYISALKFFKGDLTRVLHVASKLAEDTEKLEKLNPYLVFKINNNDLISTENEIDEWATVEKMAKTKEGSSKSWKQLMTEVQSLRKTAKSHPDRMVRSSKVSQ
ncbi:unnamed protein product [Ambrosiozyma monospora]|uniref:Unnamed protein product n=1 Tax=Ambrosiozyma monospora TaxID=43982 RepID=A0A9W6WHW2_AMBMO|nr:unnamed protein product [Ambrosiozyma monospora]